MIALDGLPFSVFVTSKDLRKCLNALGHEIPLSAETIKIKVCRYSETFREKIVRELQMEKEKGQLFSLTLDEWTSIRSKRYLNINIHSRTKVWNLGLIRISGVFSSEQCKYVIGAKLLEFGIDFETDIVCVTTDGCAMMVKLGHIIVPLQQLCYAHGLHLAVMDVLYAKKKESILVNSGYDPANIYNADETGLFFQLIPDRTLAHKDENCRGVKRMKQRITVLLCCNSTGTDKRRLLIIGKSAKPRCFRNFSPHFYCTYTSNSKPWMTSSIFQEWLLQLNKQLVSERSRILLLLDNATSHCVPNDGLSNIKIHFLPPNMTASLQPLDSGIIKSFKAQYRKLQLQKMVELADAHLPTELRLDYAVRYCKMTWDSVSPDSISNCWNHTGIIRFTSTAAVEPLNYGNLLDRIRDIFAITPENFMTEREFQLFDDSQEAEMKLTDGNFLVSTVTAKEELGEDDDATVTQRLPSLREARTAAETVLLFLEHSKRATSDDVNLSADLLRRVCAISEGEKSQVVITDFFKKMSDNLHIVNYFLKSGVDVNTRSKQGRTALMDAIFSSRSIDIVRALVIGGANVNERDVYGNTPLSSAVYCGKLIFVKILIEVGAEIDINC
ncbi:hypothetical protein LAZ67_2004890 [Cordylochernes scorpioides]|uniref:DDE-1 domain-containing protein n=1 Tax=Cordylochernes scorpioides TaxID=51811 RepID=A0ABY6K458_9ARAC|nr:hypothetical protein LAZ67_2004890 [Cordylochernes scorpioides]